MLLTSFLYEASNCRDRERMESSLGGILYFAVFINKMIGSNWGGGPLKGNSK